MVKLSVIIVAYKNMEQLKLCLTSIPAEPWLEVIVVDNTHHNRGFGAGCNVGLTLAQGKYVMFLNPDTLVEQDALQKMVDRMEKDETIGMLGPLLVDQDKQPYLSCALQPTRKSAPIVYSILNTWFRESETVKTHWFQNKPPVDETNVGGVSGAALLMPVDLCRQLGGFDEHFFMYWEEVDLAKRVLAQGYRVVFYPKARVMHAKEGSTDCVNRNILSWFRDSRFYYFRKHFGIWYALFIETWLTVTEDWRLMVGGGLLLSVAWLTWKNGGQLTTETWQYWTSIAGALGLTTAVYNELFHQKKKAAVIAFFVGLGAVVTSPAAVIINIVGMVSWIMIDMVNMSRCRSLLVKAWVLIIAVYLVTL